MTILIVEDEILMQDLLATYFEAAGYDILRAGDGIEALEQFRSHQVDLVILDIMMPKLDGFSVCRKIRKESDALIIMLTAREDEDDKLLGFELGADEYVTKPFSPKVLVARAERLLKRFDQMTMTVEEDQSPKIYRFGGLVVEAEGYQVTVDGRVLALTTKEFELLVLMVRNEQRALSRETILNQVWGEDYFGDGRVVDTNIKTLRKKLGPYSDLLKTVINVGYKFQRDGGA